MWTLLSILTISIPASAEDECDATVEDDCAAAAEDECDATALTEALAETSPAAMPAAWLELHQCDEAVANESIDLLIEKMLASDSANTVLTKLIGAEAIAQTVGWIEGLESHEKSQTIAWLGEQCNADDNVSGFFVSVHEQKQDKFFSERWHRGLAGCRTEQIGALLTSEIEARTADGKVNNPAEFFSVLETYSRNLGIKAIPTLTTLGATIKNEEVLSYIVNSYADAAHVGGDMGTNPVAADAAIEAIVGLAPMLPPRAILQARTTLTALDAEQEADGMAKYRWPELMIEQDHYLYGVTATETMTCKNGKQYGYHHYAAFTESGNQWPEQLEAALPDKLTLEWELNAAVKCKGEGDIVFAMTKEPVASQDALAAWFTEQAKGFEGSTQEFKKAKTREQDAFEM